MAHAQAGATACADVQAATGLETTGLQATGLEATGLEALLRQRPELWKASQLGRSVAPSVRSGFPELDNELPGNGWPRSTLIELLMNRPGVGELRFLMPIIQKMAWEKKTILLLCPPHEPFAPAFQQYGVAPEALLVVQARHPADRLWAVEQTMKSDSFGMCIAWLPDDITPARTDQLRRLQMAAAQSGGLSFVLRGAKSQHTPSPAPLRLFLSAASPQHVRVELLKRRGPVLEKPLIVQLPQPRAWLPESYRDALSNPPHTEHKANREAAMDRFVFPAVSTAKPHGGDGAGGRTYSGLHN